MICVERPHKRAFSSLHFPDRHLSHHTAINLYVRIPLGRHAQSHQVTTSRVKVAQRLWCLRLVVSLASQQSANVIIIVVVVY